MTQSPADRAGTHVSAQVAAAWSDLDAAHRAGELTAALRGQDRSLLGAMRESQVVRDFVGSPENILGRTDTKHGEIAEQVHVGVSRARDVLYGRVPAATFDGVPRTGPVDYRVDGVDIQSKYYNGLRNTLDGVASHTEKYPDFAGEHGRYHIPRDQHQRLEELRRTGRIEGLSDRSAAAIQRRAADLEQATGRSATDLIEPGEATYPEVQRGRVHDTLRDREDELARANEDLRQAARAEHGPSLAGPGTAATAFDPESNTRLLEASVQAAENVGVPEERIVGASAVCDYGSASPDLVARPCAHLLFGCASPAIKPIGLDMVAEIARHAAPAARAGSHEHRKSGRIGGR